mgnify:CR=1 FL=1
MPRNTIVSAPVASLAITNEEIAEKLAVAEPTRGCQKYHAYEYVGYSANTEGYHQWTCSACGDTSIRVCTVAHGGHARCQACEVVGYAYLSG